MPDLPPVVVDTNIISLALLRGQSGLADALLHSEHRFFLCELVLIELFKRKEKIVQASRLSEDEIVRFYYTLLRRIGVFKGFARFFEAETIEPVRS